MLKRLIAVLVVAYIASLFLNFTQSYAGSGTMLLARQTQPSSPPLEFGPIIKEPKKPSKETPVREQEIQREEEKDNAEEPDEPEPEAPLEQKSVPPQPQVQPSAPVTDQPVQQRPPVFQFPARKPAYTQPAVPQTTSGEGISFNFDDADVFSVIQTIFGDILKVNYIVDPKVQGRVNFRSVSPIARKDVLPVMEVILRLNGIGIVEADGLYRLIPIGDLPKEPTAVGMGREAGTVMKSGKALVQVIPVRYVTSAELLSILTPFLSANAVMMDVPRSNSIVVVDTDANVKRLLQLVEIFDNEGLKQTKPQVYVYPVQNSKAKDVATMLQQIFLGATTTASTAKTPARTTKSTDAASQKTAESAPVTQPQTSAAVKAGEAIVSEITRIIPDEIQNTITILATPDDYAVIAEAIKKIDVAPRQVMIEALVASITLTDNLRFGLQWTIQNEFRIKGLKPFNNDEINLSGPLTLNTPLSASTFSFTALDPSGDIKLKIESLAEENRAKVLSAPHILVSDNREAKIQVGDQIPIATQLTTNTGTTPAQTTTSIQYKDTGTILTVKPQVNDSGLVALEITQEVSLAETTQVLGTEQFIIRKREVTTNLVAQDGQTIVIGGLIDEQTTKGRAGIPFLSKIPILGYLFGRTVDDLTRTELIVLLTPHVIRNQDEAGDVTSGYLERLKEKNKEMDLKKDQLNIEKMKKEPRVPEDNMDGDKAPDHP